MLDDYTTTLNIILVRISTSMPEAYGVTTGNMGMVENGWLIQWESS